MRRRGCLAMGLAIPVAALVSACGALPDKPQRPSLYDFGPGPMTDRPADRMARLPAVVLADVVAPPALEGDALLYRLAYADAHQLRPYAHARWTMPPPQLLRQRLREHLSARRPVLAPGEAAAGVQLMVELEEFSQIFEAADRSVGLLRLRATLVDLTTAPHRLMAQRPVVVTRPAPSADAAGAVRALSDCAEAASGEIALWLMQAAPR